MLLERLGSILVCYLQDTSKELTFFFISCPNGASPTWIAICNGREVLWKGMTE
jgi:hypothetical protein